MHLLSTQIPVWGWCPLWKILEPPLLRTTIYSGKEFWGPPYVSASETDHFTIHLSDFWTMIHPYYIDVLFLCSCFDCTVRWGHILVVPSIVSKCNTPPLFCKELSFRVLNYETKRMRKTGLVYVCLTPFPDTKMCRISFLFC